MSRPVAEQFAAAVARAADGTPYEVTPTATGFDVGVNIVDEQWYGVLSKSGLRKTFVHHVEVRDSDRSYSITDESRTIRWVAGVPQLTGSVQMQKGRIIEFGAEKVWAFDEHGNFGVQADYRFGSQEGRDLIEGVAKQLGLGSRRGMHEKIGIGMALTVAVGIVVMGVIGVALWSLGYR
ncbi:hypothetical protein [Nocardioides lianchengensis]|uniref:Uncharacterized protein n=1 Tax=Nocardioides lianchengensis TaxID=1045774 RepID=A0A1G6YHC4_9ACTN|nr:hypothetical protein [Nocardioides lianchengensis]NYG09647.1 hypothetical protein [Nocardioides lianchengensis]SDD89681.1 hypothetical protein SAMN05421872_11246 [Nocardioides lianchengensis]